MNHRHSHSSLKPLPFSKAFQSPFLLHLYNKSSRFSIIPLLRRFLSKSIHFMESLFFSNDDDFLSNSFDHSFLPPSFFDAGESLFLVSFRWWMDAVCNSSGAGGLGEVSGALYNATVRLNAAGMENGDEETGIGGYADSEIVVDMRREGETGLGGEEGVSCGEGDLALLSEWMFFTALKRHYDKKDVDSSLLEEDSTHNVLFSLQIRLFYASEMNQLVIKISQKDNERAFNRVHGIFSTEAAMLRIWDFSGQTSQFLINNIKSSTNSVLPNEISLNLQVYEVSSIDKERGRESMTEDQSMSDAPSSSSLWINGSMDKVNLFSKVLPSFSSGLGINTTPSLGLSGLYNLGNTCFMNSAMQCLVHTPKLVDYFLGNFRQDLNFDNPLGMNGKLAVAFGDLLRKLWTPGTTSVSPRMFKSTISSFAPQFSGYNQHDSQEFLSFLLDGLHEDLNRVREKPYVQAKDDDDRPDEVVADEYWGNHIARNDSIIVDLCQGQYRSTLVCPVCKKSSITFDPFMYLSLPLPSSTLRKMTLTVLSTDGTTTPYPVTVTVPENGTFKDLVESLGAACSLRDDETLLIAEIFSNSILRILDDPNDSLELIRDYDQLVAYKLPKDCDGSPLVEFVHQQRSDLPSLASPKKFGVPFVARMANFSKRSELRKEFLKFLLPREQFLNDNAAQKCTIADEDSEDAMLEDAANIKTEAENGLDAHPDFEIYLENDNIASRNLKMQMDEPLPISSSNRPIKVVVSWPDKIRQDYDKSLSSPLPEVCKPAVISKWSQDSISLYKCVDAFLKVEPLGPDDMWYCPKCKEHRQASKKLDLWRLPEILVIHLKRFSYTRSSKNKLESFVDFPIDDFDLSDYIIQTVTGVRHCYMLYAVSNHYGGMGGGHYTAFAKHKHERWYEFDDSHVAPVSEDQIKSQAAYVLFYKRL